MEVWKKIEGFEYYQISNQGNVKSLYFNKEFLRAEKVEKNGYMRVILTKDNQQFTFLTHRLVAKYFVDNPENKPCVNHKDENKLNNNDWNLEWSTYEENNQYGTRGKRISEKLKKEVWKIGESGEVLEIYESVNEASKQEKISIGLISMICNGKRKGNFKFKN